MRIPKVMSTQHPDNVASPFFSTNVVLSGDDEVLEAFYAYSHLGADEQMWDCEGKEVDAYVVKKLFTKHEEFFRENILGRDLRLTLRVPNPEEEKAEAKILLEQLETIPRVFDLSKLFYGEDIAPIFEVILPMAKEANTIDRIYKYYMNYVVGKQNKSTKEGDITIAEWIGEFKPATINVIPLFEDLEYMLKAPEILREYLLDKEVKEQRVFLARSDPSLNYGVVSAVLMVKIALQGLYKLQEEIGVKIYPILGVGPCPFRGGLTPVTVDRCLAEYPSNHTWTIQSAFKYDYSNAKVKKAVKKIMNHETTAPHEIDVDRALDIIERYKNEYQKQITDLAPIINKCAKHVPSRRLRKLHTGLFGYQRNMGGITFPRAISFCSSLYSLGMPPELLGLNALTEEDIKYLRKVYVNFDEDIRDCIKYVNIDTGLVPEALLPILKELVEKYEVDLEHKKLTGHIVDLLKNHKSEDVQVNIVRAAKLRRFLG